jgi:hypothetical protein
MTQLAPAPAAQPNSIRRSAKGSCPPKCCGPPGGAMALLMRGRAGDARSTVPVQRAVQPAVHHARHGHAAAVRDHDPVRVRELHRAAADRCARRGVPQPERLLVLAVPVRQPDRPVRVPHTWRAGSALSTAAWEGPRSVGLGLTRVGWSVVAGAVLGEEFAALAGAVGVAVSARSGGSFSAQPQAVRPGRAGRRWRRGFSSGGITAAATGCVRFLACGPRPRSSRRWHLGTARSACRGDTVRMLSDDSSEKHHDCSVTTIVTAINDTRRA